MKTNGKDYEEYVELFLDSIKKASDTVNDNVCHRVTDTIGAVDVDKDTALKFGIGFVTGAVTAAIITGVVMKKRTTPDKDKDKDKDKEEEEERRTSSSVLIVTTPKHQ